MAVLIQFAVSRFRAPRAGLRVPDSFVWVVLALLMGVGGLVLAGVGASMGEEMFWLHDAGRAIILQGMFTGFVLGVGGMLLPVITRGVPPLAAASSRGAKLWHLSAGLAFIATFFVEALFSVRLGFALRAAIVLGVLLASAEIWRRPHAARAAPALRLDSGVAASSRLRPRGRSSRSIPRPGCTWSSSDASG